MKLLRGTRHKSRLFSNVALLGLIAGAPISAMWANAAFAQAASQDSGATSVETVLVTAEKQVEDIQKVPVPVTVLSADNLTSNSQVLLRDYYATVPGLSVVPNFTGQQSLSIRGITTGNASNPTVGVLVDDVPYGTSTFWAGNEVPDFDPADLARVEILQGPQGVLYGANSMGGLIKYVTKDPSTDRYSGRLEVGTSGVNNGSDPGFSIRASGNIPLSDTAAVRLSAYDRQDPGYIDNPIANLTGVNRTEAQGGRAALLWNLTDDVRLKLTALYQHSKIYGSPDVNIAPGLGDLQQNYIPGVGGYDRTVQFYSAELAAKLLGLDVTSITGYGNNRFTGTLDYTSVFGSGVLPIFGVGGVDYHDHDNVTKLTEELRIGSTLWDVVDWRIGGFFTHEHSPDDEYFYAINTTTGANAGVYYHGLFPTSYNEYAAFGDLTYHITDRFDVQLGARESHVEVKNLTQTQSGPLTGSTTPSVSAPLTAPADVFTYLLTPRYQISDDLMVYARIASGYRPGGPNTPFPGAASSYSPDKTKNYELGAKGDFFDHLLTLDASLYYIDWTNVQIQVKTPTGFDYQTNGASAKSEGVSLDLTLRPTDTLTLSGWVNFDDAVLTEDFPISSTAYGRAGDRLPNSSRWSSNISANQDIPLALWQGATAYLGGQLSYVGDRVSVFTGSATRQIFPEYVRVDLRAGVRYDTWTINGYINNVGDKRGVLQGGIGFFPANAFDYIQPRTVGVTISKDF